MGASGPRWPLLVLGLVVLLAGAHQLHNLDIWLHVRTGEWIVEHGRVPATNVLSRLHSDNPTVDDKWGFQILAFALVERCGPQACVVARELLLLALFGVLAGTALRHGAGTRSTLAFLLVAWLAARSRFTFRPDLVSLLLAAVVAHLVTTRRPERRVVAGLLLLQLLWVNMHGYFIQGPLTVAAAGGALLLLRDTRAQGLRWLAVAAGMAAVCLANPAGLDGALHPLAILQDLREHHDFYSQAILEFRPTFAEDPRQPWDRLAFVALLGAASPLLVVSVLRAGASRRPAALAALAIALLYGLQTPALRRNMAPFAVVVAPFAAAAWTQLAGGWSARVKVAGGIAACALAGGLLRGELSDAISIHDGLDRRWGPQISRIAYPDAGIDFIAQHLPRASVFTAFSYGSTFTGRRWPEQAAATDGNTHGYPTAYLIEVMGALSGSDPLAFERLADRDGHDVALLPCAGPLSFQLLADPRWTLVCVGGRECVFVRRDAMEPGWLAAHDLEADPAAAEPLDTPVEPPALGLLPRCHAPLFEIDQALLLRAAGARPLALERARRAAATAPRHAEALALCGLLEIEQGDAAVGRAQLRQSLALGGFNRLSDEAQRALGE